MGVPFLRIIMIDRPRALVESSVVGALPGVASCLVDLLIPARTPFVSVLVGGLATGSHAGRIGGLRPPQPCS
jgi:hypothetical protein